MCLGGGVLGGGGGVEVPPLVVVKVASLDKKGSLLSVNYKHG